MHRRAFIASLTTLAAAVPLAAHEGHDHKLLGTVAEVSPGRLVVKAVKDGALTPVVLTPSTVYRRAKTVIGLTALAVGDRVVVNIGSGKAPITAKAVDAGASTAARR
jgi:hypothetical protein